MKSKASLYLLFFMHIILYGADREIENGCSEIRKQAHAKVDQELEGVLEIMKKHSEKSGAVEFKRLQEEEGLAPDDAITKLCYGCTRQQFEHAIRECKLGLARIAVKNQDQVADIIDKFNLEEAIQVALKA